MIDHNGRVCPLMEGLPVLITTVSSAPRSEPDTGKVFRKYLLNE